MILFGQNSVFVKNSTQLLTEMDAVPGVIVTLQNIWIKQLTLIKVRNLYKMIFRI